MSSNIMHTFIESQRIELCAWRMPVGSDTMETGIERVHPGPIAFIYAIMLLACGLTSVLFNIPNPIHRSHPPRKESSPKIQHKYSLIDDAKDQRPCNDEQFPLPNDAVVGLIEKTGRI
ncbi:uncharacterized protein EDB93DRAFT_1255137 [Suillus bovinus]|uniref:uncharacterized protein n=1 Tax=Suillus bovinus TaxID=48563 RepID=UPI001B861867|nr:uncharacterized protein EDB93DRAFT_1255137 [Suillus bovinus]KAG2132724.1 hypothetical protein EDB93DRAFT_1255137 [Suillus bovinus]